MDKHPAGTAPRVLDTAPVMLKGMTVRQLRSWVQDQRYPPYRANQLYNWLYHKGVTSADQMLNLPAEFRSILARETMLATAEIISRTASNREPVVKFLFRLDDGASVEAVSMVATDPRNATPRHTLCVSSQVGCNLDCGFCATADMGFSRNLTSGEILDQFILAQATRNRPVSHVVFMGMGEPFLNYDRVIQAAAILHDPDAMNLGGQRITISTAGVVPQIHRFVDENQPFRLAISLNAADDKTRNDIMPINKTWPLKELLSAAHRYANRPRRRVTFEYVLMAGINDHPAQARDLKARLKGMSCKLNLIPYNDIGGPYHRSDPHAMDAFMGELKDSDFPVTVRWSNGTDIDAGCGQLASRQSL